MNQAKSFDSDLGTNVRKTARPSGRRGIIKSTPLEGQAAPSPWWWCLLVACVVVDGLVMSRAYRM
jgi:hypothetical protein